MHGMTSRFVVPVGTSIHRLKLRRNTVTDNLSTPFPTHTQILLRLHCMCHIGDMNGYEKQQVAERKKKRKLEKVAERKGKKESVELPIDLLGMALKQTNPEGGGVVSRFHKLTKSCLTRRRHFLTRFDHLFRYLRILQRDRCIRILKVLIWILLIEWLNLFSTQKEY